MTFEALLSDPRVLVRHGGPPDAEGRCVVYWMQRAQRIDDNPALDLAIAAGNLLHKPVVVFLGVVPFYPRANVRHYAFLADGLEDLAAGAERRRVGFVLRRYPDHRLAQFCEQVRASLVVGDENPMREPTRWREAAARELRTPLWTVDADVIVPSRLLVKEHYAARTIRPRLREHVPRFLEAPDRTKARVAWRAPRGMARLRPGPRALDGLTLDQSASPVPGVRGGPSAAASTLRSFLRDRLTGYATGRNRPEIDGTSHLSPYLHFGHIGPRTVALAVQRAEAPKIDRDVFLEEFIIRRELAINFVHYNRQYDSLQSAEPWALRTLDAHRGGGRRSTYSERQLDEAATHDPLWNAAQRQMRTTGWMHGYMRMYWAKKILEWTKAPEEAFEIAVRLNDRYELDGRDPNGYAGIAWAIGGKHDRAWGPARPVFGTVRYMSYESTRRKFDSAAYVAMHGEALR